jgi:hypothetical protein
MAAEKKPARDTAETDRILRAAAEAVLELAEVRAKQVLETAAEDAKVVLEKATTTTTDTNKRWHIGKEIPLVIVGAIIMQTAGFVWWLSQLSSNVSSLNTAFAEFKLERYTREDARRDRELIDQKLQAQLPVDRELERRINSIESRIDRLGK